MTSPMVTYLERIHPANIKYLAGRLRLLVKSRLWLQVIIAMALGLQTGLLLSPDAGWLSRAQAVTVGEWVALPGKLFLAFIQMIVVPLILSSIVRGIAAATDMSQLRSAGIWLGSYFLATTVLAVSTGIALGSILRPGDYVTRPETGTAADTRTQDIESQALEAARTDQLSLADLPGAVTGLLPTNPLGALVEGQMLQIVIFALIFGIGLLRLTPESSRPLLDLMGSVQDLCMSIVAMVMTIAPLAVFGLLTQAMILTGPQVLTGLAVYAGAVVLGMGVLSVMYLFLAMVLGGRSPLRVLVGIRDPFLIAFSTDSSAATMPISVKSAEERLRVRPSIAQLVIPLGATINMGGTALYQGLATVFMAQMFDIELPLSALIALVATAVGASIGTPAVPGVGIIVLASVLSSAGVPLSGLALIIGVDQILERFRASLNVTGDLVACVLMDRLMPMRSDREGEMAMQRAMNRKRRGETQDVIIQ